MGWFSDDPGIIAEGVQILYVVAVVSLAQVSQVIFTGSLRGAGDTRYNAIISFFSIDLLRPLVAYVLCHILQVGVIGAWVALALDQYLRFILVTVHFYHGKWMKINL